jgi:hypothetical protein
MGTYMPSSFESSHIVQFIITSELHLFSTSSEISTASDDTTVDATFTAYV